METVITMKNKKGDATIGFSKIGRMISIHTNDLQGRDVYKIDGSRLRSIVESPGVFHNLSSRSYEPLVLYRRGDEIIFHNTHTSWKFQYEEMDKVLSELEMPYGEIRRANSTLA